MQPVLTICERTGKWATAWRRTTRGAAWRVPLQEVRGLDECREALAPVRAGFVLVEMTGDNIAGLCKFLDRLQFDYPAARAAVLAQRGLDAYELIVRELGAIHFVDSPRRLAPLVGVVQRYLASQPSPQASAGEQIWERLPWKPAVAGTTDVH
jgi:hypothetical protein